jgi:thymidylate synthase ThyX
MPEEVIEAGFEKEYRAAMNEAKAAYDTIAKELPEEAQYVVPMAYNIRWYWTLNLRSVQWLTELRSQAAGHTCYRRMAQQMARCIEEKIPSLKRFLGFVDYEERPVGRLDQEIRSEKKVAALK